VKKKKKKKKKKQPKTVKAWAFVTEYGIPFVYEWRKNAVINRRGFNGQGVRCGLVVRIELPLPKE